jgi:hypothetical protein
LTAITAEIPFLEESKAENTIPGKNFGHVRTVTVSNFPKVVEGPPALRNDPTQRKTAEQEEERNQQSPDAETLDHKVSEKGHHQNAAYHHADYLPRISKG